MKTNKVEEENELEKTEINHVLNLLQDTKLMGRIITKVEEETHAIYKRTDDFLDQFRGIIRNDPLFRKKVVNLLEPTFQKKMSQVTINKGPYFISPLHWLHL